MFSSLNLFESTRRLIGKAGRKTLFRDYLSDIAGLTLVQILILRAMIFISGGEAENQAVFAVLGFSTVGIVFITSVIAGIILPWKELWKPSKEDELDGRIPLALLTLLYAGGIAVVMFITLILAIAFFFPG